MNRNGFDQDLLREILWRLEGTHPTEYNYAKSDITLECHSWHQNTQLTQYILKHCHKLISIQEEPNPFTLPSDFPSGAPRRGVTKSIKLQSKSGLISTLQITNKEETN